jgi:hypothetical protein
MDILPKAQRDLWNELLPSRGLGFVLYGGTAIALRLGHRPSVDFDFFTEKLLDHDALRREFPFLKEATLLQQERNSLHFLVPAGSLKEEYVKLSFFGSIAFGRIGEPEVTEDGIVEVASLLDLMATKLKVILQRAEAKDYRDIAKMLAAGVPLAQGLAGARILYGSAFQISESLKALVYFGDGDLHSLSREEKNILLKAASSIGAGAVPEIPLLSPKLGGESV